MEDHILTGEEEPTTTSEEVIENETDETGEAGEQATEQEIESTSEDSEDETEEGVSEGSESSEEWGTTVTVSVDSVSMDTDLASLGFVPVALFCIIFLLGIIALGGD